MLDDPEEREEVRELLEGLADGPRDDAELGLEIRSFEEAQ